MIKILTDYTGLETRCSIDKRPKICAVEPRWFKLSVNSKKFQNFGWPTMFSMYFNSNCCLTGIRLTCTFCSSLHGNICCIYPFYPHICILISLKVSNEADYLHTHFKAMNWLPVLALKTLFRQSSHPFITFFFQSVYSTCVLSVNDVLLNIRFEFELSGV